MAVSPRDPRYATSDSSPQARPAPAPTAVLEAPAVHVAVTGRMCEIRPSFRAHAEDLLRRVAKFDAKATRAEVELSRETNPRLSGSAYCVELAVRSKGKVIRAEASGPAPDAALDLAWEKLQVRLRRSHRRRVDHMPRRSRFAGTILRGAEPASAPVGATPSQPSPAAEPDTSPAPYAEGPFLLREARQAPRTMSVDEALYEMELTGQEILSFVDREAGQPCVLHRGRGYSYALMRLDVP